MKTTFKKMLAVLTAVLMLLCTMPFGVITAEGDIIGGEYFPKANPRAHISGEESPAEPGQGIPGDYDCDGDVDIQDAILTLRAALCLIESSEQSLINADMDGSGYFNVQDAITILRMAMASSEHTMPTTPAPQEDDVIFDVRSSGEPYYAMPGESVAVTLTIAGAYTAHGLIANLFFDDTLLTIEKTEGEDDDGNPTEVDWIEKGDALSKICENAAVLLQTIPASETEPACVALGIMAATKAFKAEGELFTVHFKVAETAEIGAELPLEISVADFINFPLDADATDIPSFWYDGSIVIGRNPNFPEPMSLDNALNISGGTLHFENDENYPWEIVEDYVKSTNHEDGSEAIITTSVNCTEDMALQFNYKVESEYYYDGIRIYIDGERVGNILSGWYSDEWYTYACPVPTGEHTVGISYRKDESCSEDEDAAWLDNVSVAPKIPVESVTINPGSLTINGSDEETLGVTILPEDATFKDVEWDCSDTSVVDFNWIDNDYGEAEIYSVGPGTATITATVDGVSASCEVTVLPVELEGISIDPVELTIEGSGYGYIYLTFEPSNAFHGDVEWSSSDNSVVDIEWCSNGDAEIQGVSPGTATITAAVDGFSANCEVTVLPVELQSISLNPAELTIEGSDYEYIYLNTEPWNAFHGEVQWSCSDTSVVYIDWCSNNGADIYSVGAGTATITAALDGKTASCEVTVLPVDVENILLPAAVTVLTSGSVKIYAEFEPYNALFDDTGLEWSSSDTSVVTVQSQGVNKDGEHYAEIYGKKAGTATICASLDGLTAECRVTVLEIEQKPGVTVGSYTMANGDWAYGYNGYNNATDNAIITLIDDCATVVTEQHGEYLINPAVVENYERAVDPDTGDVTYTWKIRENLVFNNGDPIKAENFIAWSLFMLSPAGTAMEAMNQGGINSTPGAYEYNVGAVPYLSGIHLINDYTFSTTSLATGIDGSELLPYYYELTSFIFRAVHIPYWFGEGWHVADNGEGVCFENDNPDILFTKDNIEAAFTAAQYSRGGDHITAGPYNLVCFNPDSGQAILQINENYNGDFEGRMPSIPQITIKYVDYADDPADALVSGEIDFCSFITGGNEINAALELIENGGVDVNIDTFDRTGFGYFAFQCDFGPTQWKEFRQAVAYLIDRNEFADTFCKGWGFKVDGPYATAFKMYQDSVDWINENLNPYDFNPEKAVECLKSIGFTLNADGTPYVDGSGKLRYKEVTAEEGQYYGDDNLGWNVTLADGRILMPARVNWCSSQANEVSELLAVMLADSDATRNAGIEIIKTEMPFPELINWLFRGFGDPKYATPTYNMFNFATNWSRAVYDMSYNWTSDPEYLAAGYNELHLYDEELDQLSMDMVYAVEPGDYESYLDIWRQYIDRFNDLLPQVPLYSNIYISVYPKTITNYDEDSYWGWERALLYADWIGSGVSEPGDYDDDGKVTVQDAIMILRSAMNLISGDAPAAADVDGNGTVNVQDAILALRMAMGLI